MGEKRKYIDINEIIRDYLPMSRKKARKFVLSYPNIEAFNEDYASTGYVIHLPDGDPYMPDSISQKWARFSKSNGIRYLCLHDIRHTVASQMIHKNVNCKAVQAIMGHADIKVTLDTYAHPYKEDEKAAIDALSEVTFKGTAEIKSKPVLPPMDDSSSMTI